MSGHMPECKVDIRPPELCWVCAALRACEQRSYALGIEVGKHDGWISGHTAGVQAAREAVKNTPCPEGYEAKGCSHWDDALAAIDALRGEQ